MSPITQNIARHIREVHFGNNWTWSVMQDVLKNITWQQAVAQPIPNSNSIALLVFHINSYVKAVHNRLLGIPDTFKHDDSFALPSISSEADWQALLQKTWEDAEYLAQSVEQMSEEQLWQQVTPQNGNFYKNLHGVVEHTHYHLGQIVLLKKLFS